MEPPRPPVSARQLARRAMTVGRVLVGVAVITAAVLLFTDSRASEEDKDIAYMQRDATAARSLSLAEQILSACEDGSIPSQYATSCNKAAEISAEPVPPMQGPRGEPGMPGLRGEKGERGQKGERGDPCLPSIPECRGLPGIDGVDGVDGQDGQDGKDGGEGRPGPAGPACQSGEAVEPYTWSDGRAGSRCVVPAPPPDELPG